MLVKTIIYNLIFIFLFNCTEKKSNSNDLVLGSILLLNQRNSQTIIEPTNSTARLNTPIGIKANKDFTGLWIADSLNHTIRFVNLNNLQVTTPFGLAGTSGTTNGFNNTARFNTPAWIGFDDLNFFVSESASHTIRKLATNGLVTTYIGQAGVSGTANNGGISTQLNSPAGFYYLSGVNVFADTLNHSLRLMSTDSNITRLVGGALATSGYAEGFTNSGLTSSTARLNRPTGVAYILANLDVNDPVNTKNFFITDTGNHCIRKITNVWQVSTNSLASSSNLATTDTNYRSLPFTTYSGAVSATLATGGAVDGNISIATFNSPTGIVGDETNMMLYIADTGNHTIRKIDLRTSTVSTIAGSVGQTGSTDGTGMVARFNSPRGLELIFPFLYVTDTGNHTIRRIDLRNNSVRTILGLATQSGSAN